jgi:hypothetical protein
LAIQSDRFKNTGLPDVVLPNDQIRTPQALDLQLADAAVTANLERGECELVWHIASREDGMITKVVSDRVIMAIRSDPSHDL